MILIWRCTPAIVAKCLEPKCNIGTHEHLTHVRHTPSLTKARYACAHYIHVPRQPKECTISIFVWKPVFFQHIHFLFIHVQKQRCFLIIFVFWVRRVLLACLATWAVMKRGNKENLKKNHLRHNFRNCPYWGIVARIRLDLIGWL